VGAPGPVDLDDEVLVVHTFHALDLLADAGARYLLQSIAR
jgi:hypothetical protein